MRFRKDINGLRAIAVIAVVLFHFNEAWLPGGFAGVDVFFVISGFLMTSIIFRGIEKNKFSILNFYIDRVNRIVPALAFLCLILLILGYLYLAPIDFRVLGKHVGSSISFLSNFGYWSEDGYFDVSSSEKWLLHTWSLSVEWQFYILYPLILVILRCFFSLSNLKVMILIGTVISFILSVIATFKWPSSSYYFLTGRAWEMMVGGLCYLYPFRYSNYHTKLKIVYEWIGVLFIVFSYFTFDKESQWPGYLALLPTFGAFLIIQAQRNNSFLTSNIIFQKLGIWSYSIYLWHWPVVVTIYFYALNEFFTYLGIGLSILFGFLSYKYIERINFKSDFQLNILRNYYKYSPLCISFTIGLIGSAVFLTNGLNFRGTAEYQSLNNNALKAISDWYYPKPNLEVGHHKIRFIKGSSNRNILFIGASHIEQTYPYILTLNSEYNIYYLTQGGCFLTPSYRPNLDCSNIKNYKSLIENINFESIVTSLFVIDLGLPDDELSKQKELELRVLEFNEFLSFSKERVKKIFLLLGEPKGDEFNPSLSVRHKLKNYIETGTAIKAYKTHYSLLKKINKNNGLIVINPIDYLCDEVCMVRDENLKYYYKDSDHMRPWYAKKSLNYLEQVFQ